MIKLPFHRLRKTLGSAAALVTLPGTLELSALTLASVPDLPPLDEGAESRCGKLAVVVPAHNEKENIEACVRSLLRCDEVPNGARIVVVADNCTDNTAELARAAGAEVLERNDDERRGKGYALEHAFEHVLLDADVEAALVVDADTTVAPNFLTIMARAFGSGADGAQCKYLVGNPDETDRGRLMNVALLAFNIARPRARENLGLSVGILGNGFGLHRRVLEALPYTARSVVEDLEYHLMMVQAGYRVRFVDETGVTADLPTSERGQKTQRERWEGGRYRMIREHVPRVLRRVLKGDAELIEPLGELLLLPLATHVGVLGVTLLIPYWPTQLYAAGALGVVGAHVVTSIVVGGGGAAEARAMAKAPMYVLSKVRSLPQILAASKREQAWIRTDRS